MALTATSFVHPLASLPSYYLTQDHSEYYAGYGYHLGEDWSAAPGDNDRGDRVNVAGNGKIVYAGWYSNGWGNVVIVQHTMPDGSTVSTVYGHLETITQTSGDVVAGEQIGTMGDADGRYAVHLHFAVYLGAITAPGSGYSSSPDPDPTGSGWVDPSEFIEHHQSQFTSGADNVTLTTPGGSWSALGGNDTVNGTSGYDTINGDGGRDKLYGKGGNDSLSGGGDNDSLTGGSGKDTLTGGSGYDKFVFTATSNSGTSTSSADTITDFSSVYDWVDVSGIDANTALSGDQKFILDAKGTSSSAVARGHIGWYQVNNSGSSNDFTYIRLNVDSDSAIESMIKLKGLVDLATTDFIL